MRAGNDRKAPSIIDDSWDDSSNDKVRALSDYSFNSFIPFLANHTLSMTISFPVLGQISITGFSGPGRNLLISAP